MRAWLGPGRSKRRVKLRLPSAGGMAINEFSPDSEYVVMVDPDAVRPSTIEDYCRFARPSDVSITFVFAQEIGS